MEGWDKVVPQFLREMLSSLDPKARDAVEELRLREGFPLAVVQAGEEWTHPAWRGRPLTEEALRRVLETAGRGSVHTVLDQLRSGYVTAAGGVRVGICGEGATREGELLSFRRITSLALRVPHALPGVARPLLPQLAEGGELSNTLILSPPGLGKTTLLRDLIRCVSLGEGVRPRRVGVADERGELGAGALRRQLGPRTDVLENCPKAAALLMLLRGMAPQVLAVDEITAPEDLRAIQEAAGCGVTLLATAHGEAGRSCGCGPSTGNCWTRGFFGPLWCSPWPRASESILCEGGHAMTALLGKTLLFAGCTAFGLLRGSRLRQRTACLGEFRRTLAGLARELAFSLRPVSDLMASAEAGTQGPTAAFFRTCRRRFAEGGQESWAESWTEALEQVALPLEEADLRLLQEAGDVLGRYDGESQRQALEGLLRGLEGQAAEAAETSRRLCRVYLALGLAAGLFCLILL